RLAFGAVKHGFDPPNCYPGHSRRVRGCATLRAPMIRTEAMADSLGWARVFPAVRRPPTDPNPRLGVWYPVISRGDTRVVLDVQGQHIELPEDFVEFRQKRPEKFTVVYRTADDPNPATGTRADLGRVYAVCPMSATR